jgi:hypothetical protein
MVGELSIILLTSPEQGVKLLGLLLAGSTVSTWQLAMSWPDVYWASKGSGWAVTAIMSLAMTVSLLLEPAEVAPCGWRCPHRLLRVW